MTILKPQHCGGESIHQPHWWMHNPGNEERYQCPGTAETTMTDLVIPPEVVAAAAKAIADRYEHTSAMYLTDAAAALKAALPHLRPLVEAQELRLATEVALKLGRQEVLAEIAAEMALSHPEDPRVRYVEVQIDLDTYRQIMAARDTGKGDSV